MSSDTDIITALARKLQAENDRLKAENAALRAGQGRWPEGDDLPAGEQVPRRKTMSAPPTTPGSLVLALEPRVERFREEVQRIAKAIATPQVSTDTPPAPRLTVHALNTAPVGSVAQRPKTKPWMKGADGYWRKESPHGIMRVSGDELLSAGYANATLTHPKRGDHE